MKYSIYFLLLTTLILFSCSKGSILNDDLGPNLNNVGLEGKGVIHHISAGGNDGCEAFGLTNGCDKNYSLTAKMMADGSVTGEWQDGFGKNEFGEQIGGIHVKIDCMTVDGNFASFGGFVTKGSLEGTDLVGRYAYAAIIDNGTSSKDTPDQIAFTGLIRNPENEGKCYFPSVYRFYDLTTGQVTVK